MRTPIAAAALAAVLFCAAAPGAGAQVVGVPSAATTLDLPAYGEARAAPDMASLTLGVDTTQATAAGALRANAARMTAVVAALKAAGIAGRDIQTSNINLAPQYVYEENKPARLTGYQASNQVTATVHDLATLGAVVDAVVGAGATNLGQISFGLSDPLAAETSARLAAVKALEDKAALYARAAGYRISRLINLSEGVANVTPRPPVPMMAMRVQAGAPTPVEAGEMKVRIDITGSFELVR